MSSDKIVGRLTTSQKHRFFAVGIFMALMYVLPSEVTYFKWLMFGLTVVFWFIVSMLLGIFLLSWLTDRISDDVD